jgi:hypothetical protein
MYPYGRGRLGFGLNYSDSVHCDITWRRLVKSVHKFGYGHKSECEAAASFAPGASVSIVARQYDVNSNQLFAWRKLYGDARRFVCLQRRQRRPD